MAPTLGLLSSTEANNCLNEEAPSPRHLYSRNWEEVSKLPDFSKSKVVYISVFDHKQRNSVCVAGDTRCFYSKLLFGEQTYLSQFKTMGPLKLRYFVFVWKTKIQRIYMGMCQWSHTEQTKMTHNIRKVKKNQIQSKTWSFVSNRWGSRKACKKCACWALALWVEYV